MKKIYLNPLVIFISMFIILIGSYISVDNKIYTMITDTVKIYSIDKNSMTVYIFLSITFCLGIISSLILSKLKYKKYNLKINELNINIIYKLANITFILTLIGSIIWIIAMFIKIGSINRIIYLIFKADPIELRPYRVFIPGITTLTQVGPLSIVLLYIVYFNSISDKIKKKCLFSIVTIIILALIRVRLNYERLALIEVLVPLFIIFLHYYKNDIKALRYIIIVVIFSYLTFTFGEYFKSWQFYKDIVDTNIFEFSFNRLISYYWTSINNGLYVISNNLDFSTPFYHILWWLWDFPLLDKVADYSQIFNINPYDVQWKILSSNLLNAEYNVFSIPGYAYWDSGILGAILFTMVSGFITGKLYTDIKNNKIEGLILYPIWFIGIIEFYRITYWSLGRSIVSYGIAILCILVIRSKSSTYTKK